jgi:hypothetical protein
MAPSVLILAIFVVIGTADFFRRQEVSHDFFRNCPESLLILISISYTLACSLVVTMLFIALLHLGATIC